MEKEGLCWPCPAEDHPGTPVLHMEGPAIGKGVLVSVEHNPSAETLDPTSKIPGFKQTGINISPI